MNTHQKYMQYLKDELQHYNPNHDPRDGRFTSGSNGRITNFYVQKADEHMGKRRPKIKKAAKLMQKAARAGGYSLKDIETDTAVTATDYGLRAAELAKQVMSHPGDEYNNVFIKDISNLEKMSKRYKKLAKLLDRKVKESPGDVDRPTIDGEDYEIWIRKNNKEVAKILDEYYWG